MHIEGKQVSGSNWYNTSGSCRAVAMISISSLTCPRRLRNRVLDFNVVIESSREHLLRTCRCARAAIRGMMAVFMKDQSTMVWGTDMEFSGAALIQFLTLVIGAMAKDMGRLVRTKWVRGLGWDLQEQQVLLYKGFTKVFCSVAWSYVM